MVRIVAYNNIPTSSTSHSLYRWSGEWVCVCVCVVYFKMCTCTVKPHVIEFFFFCVCAVLWIRNKKIIIFLRDFCLDWNELFDMQQYRRLSRISSRALSINYWLRQIRRIGQKVDNKWKQNHQKYFNYNEMQGTNIFEINIALYWWCTVHIDLYCICILLYNQSKLHCRTVLCTNCTYTLYLICVYFSIVGIWTTQFFFSHSVYCTCSLSRYLTIQICHT